MESIENDPYFLEHLITGDESWMFEYRHSETKRQSMEWHTSTSQRPKKNHLKGHHFGTLENIQTAVTDQLKAIPISEFHECYEEWKKRLQRCVASEGSCFEGDNDEL
ncbi:putative transposase [Trichonephila clavipes]|nr:putative transposase [Trichonephila clavipes]